MHCLKELQEFECLQNNACPKSPFKPEGISTSFISYDVIFAKALNRVKTCKKNAAVKWYVISSVKGATKLYFTHYSCVVIILFNTGLYKSAFSISSFGKLVFCLSAPFVLCLIWYNLDKVCNICLVIVNILGVRYSVFLFSLVFKKRYAS